MPNKFNSGISGIVAAVVLIIGLSLYFSEGNATMLIAGCVGCVIAFTLMSCLILNNGGCIRLLYIKT